MGRRPSRLSRMATFFSDPIRASLCSCSSGILRFSMVNRSRHCGQVFRSRPECLFNPFWSE